MPCLRLAVLRASDRSKIMNLANLYSMAVTLEGDNVLVLTKTGQTVRKNEFAVPGLPSSRTQQDMNKKRQKRTPPQSPVGLAQLGP